MFISTELTIFIMLIHLVPSLLFGVLMIPLTKKLHIDVKGKINAVILFILSVIGLVAGLQFWVAKIYLPQVLLLLFSVVTFNLVFGYLLLFMFLGKRVKNRRLRLSIVLVIISYFGIFLISGNFPKLWGVAFLTVKDTFVSATEFDDYVQNRVFGQKYENIYVEDYRVYRNRSVGTCAWTLEDFVETSHGYALLENKLLRSELTLDIKDKSTTTIYLASVTKKYFDGIKADKGIDTKKFDDMTTLYSYDKFSRLYSTSRYANYSVLLLEGRYEDKTICFPDRFGDTPLLLELLKNSDNF